ncbi:CNNM domain-containing protein [Devosia sp. MC1541]|uniref:CNNM domain-containing protein n=1 Tax=Devosia sp. MC1541 TaxID=2725264 RepID=UPI00145EAD11|nr:CNNM domain-containing protein [Devosia sp. MC1541]
MKDPTFVILATIALIVLSAFFVIIEFALIGARRRQLEEMAPQSASARAALRGMNDLTLMLAGAQLGITLCTFALGAITKPAVDAALGPILLNAGAPFWLADSAAFLLSLFFVTFLHLVVGEMAPKSWAIAHPEKAAVAIGLAAESYIWPLRPVLGVINRIANSLVRASGVEPVESTAIGGQDAATIRQLVEHSAKVGVLETEVQQQLSSLIDLGSASVSHLIAPGGKPVSVGPKASVAEVRKLAETSGHMRILLLDEGASGPKVVHVRDTLLEGGSAPAAKFARDVLALPEHTSVYEAQARMRKDGEQLAIVTAADRILGVVTMADILKRVLPHTA